ncbi:MAG TPA: glycosyltransferase family 1 protein [Methylomirabilota bacterium]|nr:glycosyltransferase family 1 protein [Methylomirabilota bacterium]
MSQSGGVGINASIIGGSPTGLGLYAINLIRALDTLREDLRVYTSCPESLGPLRARIVPATPLARPERGLRGHFMRLIWVQTALRIRARAAGHGVLLNTVPEAILGSRVPQITVVHDLLPLFFPAEYPRQQYYFRSLVPRVLKSSRVIVADSESTRRDIIQSYGIAAEKVRVIYPGYDPDSYAANGFDPRPAADSYLLYVGNLLPHKNLLSLLDALAILRRRHRARLIIRGDGQPTYARAVRERVETLGLGDAVSFQGYAAEGALRDLYAHAACLVLPSLREGFGLPVLEAMACGTPVITSSSSSLPEVGGDAALRVDPHDAIDLSDAMHRVLTDVELREDLRERGLKWVRAFSWRRTGEQMARLLDEVRG